jgi:hypothetical protein
MKFHSNQFKINIASMGRQIDAEISYGNTILSEELYAVTPHYEANILKSVMKQLDIESSIDIPKETVINCRIGLLVGNDYEYINYGNYVVYESEKQEDTDTYMITCYDKMLYAMKQNEDLHITYPISIKNYLIAIATELGLEVQSGSFYNEDLEIQSELYAGLEYTYRDILDEIAQATGSIIYINENDKIEVKYPTLTNDTIDEDYLKDVNVKFKEKYGPINSIVLSRSAEADNVYLQDEDSVAENGLCEVKIIDNQIMNWNDRSDYLEGILNALDGLEYYINDFSSTGILYYDVGDLYNIQIGENTYQCMMLNDEVDMTQGIEELIHTDMPEQSETDYDKADKTDRRINQTYLIVDKQNQQIEGVINNVEEQDEKIAQVLLTVDELNTKISDVANTTVSAESENANISLENVNASEPIQIKVHPINTNISYLYPRNNLYPSNSLYSTNRKIRFTNDTTNEYVDYELPDDLLYYNSNIYDEFLLDYENNICRVTKRCGYNADGTVYALANEIITDYTYPTISLTDGDYTISLLGYNNGYIFAKLMASNIYTTQFTTRVEMNSAITQKANEINLNVNQKFTNYSTTNQMKSAIMLTANEIISQVSNTYETKSNAQTNYSQIQQNLNSINLEVAEKLDEDDFTAANIILEINSGQSQALINADKISLAGKTINLTSDNIAINSTNFRVDKNGNVTCANFNCSNATITGGTLDLQTNTVAEDSIIMTTLEGAAGSVYTHYCRINGYQICFEEKDSDRYSILNDYGIITNGEITSKYITAGSISNNYGRIYQMSKGTVNITPSGANTPTGKAVLFSKAFSSAPTVYTTPVTSAPGTTVTGTGVSGITAKECVIYVTRTNTTTTGVSWVAFW